MLKSELTLNKSTIREVKEANHKPGKKYLQHIHGKGWVSRKISHTSAQKEKNKISLGESAKVMNRRCPEEQTLMTDKHTKRY